MMQLQISKWSQFQIQNDRSFKSQKPRSDPKSQLPLLQPRSQIPMILAPYLILHPDGLA